MHRHPVRHFVRHHARHHARRRLLQQVLSTLFIVLMTLPPELPLLFPPAVVAAPRQDERLAARLLVCLCGAAFWHKQCCTT